MWDTGTSVGTLTGISKTSNNIDVKQNRPYRVVTASEDYTVCYFEGPPFKFKNQLKVIAFLNLNFILPEIGKGSTGK